MRRTPPGYVIARPHPAPWPRSPELDRAVRFVIALIHRDRTQSDYALVH